MMVCFIVLIIDLLVYGLITRGHLKVDITSPKDGQYIGPVEMVTGSAQNIPRGEEAFLIYRSYSDGLFYPVGRIFPDLKGSWNSPNTAIGAQSDPSGSEFEIDVALADRDAQVELEGYSKRAESAGLKLLPKGVHICSRAKVKSQ
jgi:hypothetical protein